MFLLVLLIIFMVIVPVAPKGLSSEIPQPPKHPQRNDTVVLQVVVNGNCEPPYPI